MRKYQIMLVAFLMACSFISSALAGTTFTIGNGGSLNWNGRGGILCDCVKGGDDCFMSVTPFNILVSDDGDNWILTGTITNIAAFIQPVGQPSFNTTISHNNWTFPESQFAIDAGTFSGVPAMTIQMENVVTDANGNFTKTVPKNPAP